jgi:hypothetical protein
METRRTWSALIAVVVSAVALARGAGGHCRPSLAWTPSPFEGPSRHIGTLPGT